jgi:hypothetical protein
VRSRASRPWQGFVDDVVRKANAGRGARVREELDAMRVLDVDKLPEFTEESVKVSEWSTIRVKHCAYSVPSRLIGETVRVRVYEDRIEVFFAGVQEPQLACERLRGRTLRRIDYRHVIWSLVQTPGAFARYVYREEMFPSVVSAGPTTRSRRLGLRFSGAPHGRPLYRPASPRRTSWLRRLAASVTTRGAEICGSGGPSTHARGPSMLAALAMASQASKSAVQGRPQAGENKRRRYLSSMSRTPNPAMLLDVIPLVERRASTLRRSATLRTSKCPTGSQGGRRGSAHIMMIEWERRGGDGREPALEHWQTGYWVPLDQVRTDGDVDFWVQQIGEKRWATPSVVAELYAALREHVAAQARARSVA